MLLIHIFGNNDSAIPASLELRSETYTMMLIGVLALSFLLIALSRLYNGKSVPIVISLLFKGPSVEQILKDNMKLSSLSSVLLMLNYFVSFALCLFLLLIREAKIPFNLAILIAAAVPIFWFLVEVLGVFVIGILTNEQKKLTITLIHTVCGNQFFGLFFSIISLFWIMNPQLNQLFVIIFSFGFGLKYLMRLIKNVYAVLMNGVLWYYIILYFCTLEILPLFVVYQYILKNFLV